MLPPNEIAAASSKLTPAGRWTSAPSSAMVRYSAWQPIPKPDDANTASPTLNFVTALPTASISPASSVPRIGWRGPNIPNTGRAKRPNPAGILRERARQSPEETVLALTRIKTSSSFGSGLASSSMRTTSGEPY
ncbi:hypothetical protein D3C86_1737960 [compost metagenome]